MLGIHPDIAQHRINTHPYMIPVKQKLRSMKTNLFYKIEKEVAKKIIKDKNDE